MNTLENLSTHARSVMDQAKKTAKSFMHGWIGPEHFLVGILTEACCGAHRYLKDFPLILVKIKDELLEEYQIKESAAIRCNPNDPSLTRFAQTTLQFAAEEARSQGAAQVRSMHLLLGILQTDCTAAEVLKKHGVTIEHARKAMPQMLTAGAAEVGRVVVRIHPFGHTACTTPEELTAFLEHAKMLIEQQGMAVTALDVTFLPNPKKP